MSLLILSTPLFQWFVRVMNLHEMIAMADSQTFSVNYILLNINVYNFIISES